jgi:hypothetical protein
LLINKRKAFADSIGIKFIETSAKQADNVLETFQTMVSDILKYVESTKPM